MTFPVFVGLLEEERLASAHQAESFTRQIQRLQGEQKHIYNSVCITTNAFNDKYN